MISAFFQRQKFSHPATDVVVGRYSIPSVSPVFGYSRRKFRENRYFYWFKSWSFPSFVNIWKKNQSKNIWNSFPNYFHFSSKFGKKSIDKNLKLVSDSLLAPVEHGSVLGVCWCQVSFPFFVKIWKKINRKKSETRFLIISIFCQNLEKNQSKKIWNSFPIPF